MKFVFIIWNEITIVRAFSQKELPASNQKTKLDRLLAGEMGVQRLMCRIMVVNGFEITSINLSSLVSSLCYQLYPKINTIALTLSLPKILKIDELKNQIGKLRSK